MKRADTAYWLATGLFCLVLAFSGTAHLLHVERVVESMTQLGYPPYFMTILGIAKLSGVAALLVPGRPLLKEWAYAGFAFNLLGATASHVFAGDPLSHTLRPAFFLLVGAASYRLRPPSRRLGSTLTAAREETPNPLRADSPVRQGGTT